MRDYATCPSTFLTYLYIYVFNVPFKSSRTRARIIHRSQSSRRLMIQDLEELKLLLQKQGRARCIMDGGGCASTFTWKIGTVSYFGDRNGANCENFFSPSATPWHADQWRLTTLLYSSHLSAQSYKSSWVPEGSALLYYTRTSSRLSFTTFRQQITIHRLIHSKMQHRIRSVTDKRAAELAWKAADGLELGKVSLKGQAGDAQQLQTCRHTGSDPSLILNFLIQSIAFPQGSGLSFVASRSPKWQAKLPSHLNCLSIFLHIAEEYVLLLAQKQPRRLPYSFMEWE